jgi:hypothetical protein
MFIGLLIVGLTLKYQTHWIGMSAIMKSQRHTDSNLSTGPLIGGGLFYFCLSASTGVTQTYVLETYLAKSMDTQANFIFWKCIWGFIVTYFAYVSDEASLWLSHECLTETNLCRNGYSLTGS